MHQWQCEMCYKTNFVPASILCKIEAHDLIGCPFFCDLIEKTPNKPQSDKANTTPKSWKAPNMCRVGVLIQPIHQQRRHRYFSRLFTHRPWKWLKGLSILHENKCHIHYPTDWNNLMILRLNTCIMWHPHMPQKQFRNDPQHDLHAK